MHRFRESVSVQPGVVVLVAAVALGFGAPVASGQIELGVMQGIVKDEAGNPLEGVSFRIRDLERGREVVVKSDKNGRFYRRGLPAVEYEISVEKEGYQPIHDKLKLSAGVDRRFDFKLAKSSPEGAEEFVRGVAAFSEGNFQAAAQAFEASVQKAPERSEVRVNLALAYARLSRTADAVAQLERAVALDPDEPRVLFQLGDVYIELKELDKAAATLEKGLAVAQGLSDSLAYDATVTLGAVHFARGDHDKAMTQFEKALAARPDSAAPKLGLGKVYFSKGDVSKALQFFRQVVSSVPGSAEAVEAETYIKELEQVKPPAG